MSALPVSARAFPSLALAPAAPVRPGIARRELDADMAELERAQLGEPPKEDNPMPKGQYDRSKAKPRTKKAATGPGAEQPDAGTKPGKKRKRARAKLAAAAKPRRAPEPSTSLARFSVDDIGGVAIASGDVRIELVPADASRLAAFLTKYAT